MGDAVEGEELDVLSQRGPTGREIDDSEQQRGRECTHTQDVCAHKMMPLEDGRLWSAWGQRLYG